MASDNTQLTMIAAINEAVKIKKNQPYADAEDIMPTVLNVISQLSRDDKSKLSAIAAVNSTIKYMNQNPNATEKEIFQDVLNNSSNIVRNMEEE